MIEKTLARADVAAMCRQFKSEHERSFAQVAHALLANEFGAAVERLDYEPVTWNLPGNKYTPDFVAILEDGRIVQVEVKGSRKQRGYRDARSKLREAAAMHPEYAWVEAVVTLKGRSVVGISLEIIQEEHPF